MIEVIKTTNKSNGLNQDKLWILDQIWWKDKVNQNLNNDLVTKHKVIILEYKGIFHRNIYKGIIHLNLK